MPRTVEVAISLIALLILLPVFVLVALANWLTSRRILYRQTRIGRELRPFTIFKFQTMVDGADHGSSITVRDDVRVTPLGAFLRAAKLDELPQLFNVMRGEMSLVGPRALPPNEVAHIAPEIAAHVYSVRPGMTGLASLALVNEERQLAGLVDPDRYYFDVILPQKLTWESEYVRARGWWLDSVILACTPLAVASPRTVRMILSPILNRARMRAA